MKNLLLVLSLTVFCMAVNAQDKIITVQNDTIECRIISVNDGRISYEQKFSDNRIVGKSIATSDVLEYLRSGKNSSRNIFMSRQREIPEHRLLFSLQSGLTHSLTDYNNLKNVLVDQGNPASEIDDYFKKLNNGYHLSASAHYLLTPFLGVGADYSVAYFSSKGDFLVRGYAGMNLPTYVNFKMDEKLFTQFVGPSVLFQQLVGNSKKIKLSETIAPGLVFFREETRGNSYQIYWGEDGYYNGEAPQYYNVSNSLSTGNTFAIKGGLSVEYRISPQLSAGVAGSFTWAKLHKLSVKNSTGQINDQKLENDVDISRIDYGFVFRYNF